MATWRQVTERDHDDIWPVAWRWLSRARNAMMSPRPSGDGSSPRSSRCSRRLADRCCGDLVLEPWESVIWRRAR